MPTATHITWFEIPVTDMDRAITFYETVFQIKIKKVDFGTLKMGWFPPSDREGAATGTLIENEAYEPSENGTLLYFSTASILAEQHRVIPAGGSILIEKRKIGPDQGFMAVCLDTEGNRFALHASD